MKFGYSVLWSDTSTNVFFLGAWLLSCYTFSDWYCLYFYAGVLIGALNKRYGSKAVAMVGSLMTSLGLLLSSLLVNIPYLYVTYGIIAGN